MPKEKIEILLFKWGNKKVVKPIGFTTMLKD